MNPGITVLRFGDHRLPRALAGLRCREVDGAEAIDEVISGSPAAVSRLVVLGSDVDLAVVLTRLMRADRLDIEVAHPRSLPPNRLSARRAVTGTARRIPLVRDDTGTALVGCALWLPPAQAEGLEGEAVVDDTVLFDGLAPGVRIEPTGAMPGLRAAVLGTRPRRWVSGRAAQLGTTGGRVIRDGVSGPREVKRSTFYRHTTGWLRVG